MTIDKPKKREKTKQWDCQMQKFTAAKRFNRWKIRWNSTVEAGCTGNTPTRTRRSQKAEEEDAAGNDDDDDNGSSKKQLMRKKIQMMLPTMKMMTGVSEHTYKIG